MPASIPTRIPTKLRPICHSSKPWFVSNTILNAPKKRYKTPSNIAENMQRLRHMGSRSKSWKGRYTDFLIVWYDGDDQRTLRDSFGLVLYLCYRSVHDLDWRVPSLVSCLLAKLSCLVAKKD